MAEIPLDKYELKELLNKNWMTHDAMWFASCLQEFGIEKANKMNKAAIRQLGPIECRRIHKALGKPPVDTFDQFKQFFDLCMSISTGSFMKYSYDTTAKNKMHCEWKSCFAYDGMKALGVADKYECGVMYRIETWLDALGIKWEVKPKVTGCMMHTDGVCYRDYTFFFEK